MKNNSAASLAMLQNVIAAHRTAIERAAKARNLPNLVLWFGDEYRDEIPADCFDQETLHGALLEFYPKKQPPAAGEAARTPTPWIQDDGTDSVENMADSLLRDKGTEREWVAIGTSDADGYAESVAYCHPSNAAFIVRAVNNFDQLVTLARNVANEQNSPYREQALAILSRI